MSRALHPLDIRLDGDAERTRRDAAASIKTLAARGALVPLGDFDLEDGVERVINHKLGRAPLFVCFGPVIGPVTVGMIEEVPTGRRDRRRSITLKASGYGATVRVSVAVL